LDFNTFVISGPSTSSFTIGSLLNGEIKQAPAVADDVVSESGQCLTDTFSVTNQVTMPLICGTNTGEHVYLEASDACNELSFQIGTQALGITAAATRNFNIKVSQISCNSELLAPEGCVQYYYDSPTNFVRSFNYNSGTGRHLANQDQLICVRRESGNCRICWGADAAADVMLSGKIEAMAAAKDSACCAYGVAGVRAQTEAYDCLMIPGASIATNGKAAIVSQCGQGKGLITADDGASVTVCSKSYPFRIRFVSDNWEYANTDVDEGGMTGTTTQQGFKIRYYQESC